MKRITHHFAAGLLLAALGPGFGVSRGGAGTVVDSGDINVKPSPLVTKQGARSSSPGSAPAWAVSFGKEFWRRPGTETVSANNPSGTLQSSTPIDFGEVIERVSHAWTERVADSSLQVKSRAYVASLSGTELRFSPPALGLASAPHSTAAFRTISARRGGNVFFSAATTDPAWWAVGNTAQALLAPEFGLVQHCEARAAGVAVTWILAQQLPGTGSLVIEMDYSGLTCTAQTRGGHLFTEVNGAARMRVSNVTIVDSSGRRWEVPTRVEDSLLRVEVPETALAGAAYPLAVDPLISPEFVLATPGLVPVTGNSPALAAGASDFLVVWQDFRNSEPAVSHADIYGARVGTNGVVLDPAGFAICIETNDQASPAVANNGTNYLVVWEDTRDGPGTNIYGTRVSSAGMVLDANGIAISTAANAQTHPAVAARQGDFLVVWEDRRNGSDSDIYGARVANTGGVADLEGIPIRIAPNEQRGPAVASNGTNWLVVYDSLRPGISFAYAGDIHATRVTSAGAVSDPGGGIVIRSGGDPGQFNPAVTSNGTNYFVVWRDYRNGFYNGDIYGARVTGAGGLTDPAGIAISTAPQEQLYPTVAYSQNRYLVTWQDHRNADGANGYAPDIFAARVTESGGVANPAGIPVRTNYLDWEGTPRVASRGGIFLVVWDGAVGARVTTAGTVLDTNAIPIKLGPGAQWRPVVAFNRNHYLVVWEESREGIALWGTRVTKTGVVADPQGLPISPPFVGAGSPALAANSDEFLVLWGDAGARVTDAGKVFPLSGLPVPLPWNDIATPLTLAANGNGYLAVWGGRRNAGTNATDIFAARITPAGGIVDTNGFAVCTMTNEQFAPSVAANGSDWLVVWQDHRFHNPINGFPYPNVYGARVTPGGTVAETNGFKISHSDNSYLRTAVAANGTDWLVVWPDTRGNGAGRGIYGARVNRSGTVAEPDGIPIPIPPPGAIAYANPDVAANGSDFLVVWTDGRNSSFGSNFDVYGTRVSGAGRVLDAANLLIGFKNDWYIAQYPKVASDGSGRYLVVSQSFHEAETRAVGSLVDVRPILGSITSEGGAVTVSWQADEGTTYRVQYKARVDSTEWIDLPGDVTATGPTASKTDDTLGGNTQRYYRVGPIP